MKILEINKFNYAKGGADRHFLDLVQLLKAHGHEVAVFCMDSPRNNLSTWKKYFVSYVGYNQNDSTFWERILGVSRMFYSLEAQRKMRKLLADFKPDLVHIHNIYHQISPSILTEIKKKNIPIVMTVHDYKLICPDYLLRDWESLGKYRYAKFILRKKFKNSRLKSFLAVAEFLWHKRLGLYAKNIDQYICPSLFLKNKLVANGIEENKIIVLPHFFLPAEKEDKAEEAVSEKYAFYFGKIAQDKNVSELVSLFRQRRDIKLYLAGEMESGFELENDPQIKYLGVLEKTELEDYIKKALFVVSGSKLPETFGLIALEALSFGKPFIGYDTGAYGEVIENGQTGFLCQNSVKFGESIDLLTQDENLREVFSQNAYLRAKTFSGVSYAEKIGGIFEQLTKTPKNGSIIG